MFRDTAADRHSARARLDTRAAIAAGSMPYWREVVARTRDPDLEARARIALGFDRYGADSREQESQLLRGLRTIWQHEDRFLFAGLLRLVDLYRVPFRVTERLALLSRAQTHAEQDGSPRAMAAVQQALAQTLLELGDHARAREAVASVWDQERREAGSVDAIGHRMTRFTEARLDLREGDAAHARAWLTEYGDQVGTESWATLAGEVHELTGDPAGALRLYRRWNGGPDLTWHTRAYADMQMARLRLIVEDGPAAERNTIEVLEKLCGDPLHDLGPGRRCEVALTLGGLLARRARAPGTLQRALDLVGAAALERLGEMTEFFADPPGPLPLDPQFEQTLSSRRARLRDGHTRLMGAAAGLVTDDPSRVRRLAADEGGELLLVCAWCRSVAVGGAWIALTEYAPPSGPLRLSHGICDACGPGLDLGPDATSDD